MKILCNPCGETLFHSVSINEILILSYHVIISLYRTDVYINFNDMLILGNAFYHHPDSITKIHIIFLPHKQSSAFLSSYNQIILYISENFNIHIYFPSYFLLSQLFYVYLQQINRQVLKNTSAQDKQACYIQQYQTTLRLSARRKTI